MASSEIDLIGNFLDRMDWFDSSSRKKVRLGILVADYDEYDGDQRPISEWQMSMLYVRWLQQGQQIPPLSSLPDAV